MWRIISLKLIASVCKCHYHQEQVGYQLGEQQNQAAWIKRLKLERNQIKSKFGVDQNGLSEWKSSLKNKPLCLWTWNCDQSKADSENSDFDKWVFFPKKVRDSVATQLLREKRSLMKQQFWLGWTETKLTSALTSEEHFYNMSSSVCNCKNLAHVRVYGVNNGVNCGVTWRRVLIRKQVNC